MDDMTAHLRLFQTICTLWLIVTVIGWLINYQGKLQCIGMGALIGTMVYDLAIVVYYTLRQKDRNDRREAK